MTEVLQFVVIIPTKNRRALLERALGSVLSQSYEAYRIIIINDGSTDCTRDYLDTLSNTRITVIHHPRSRGVNAARNAGLKTLTTGEWALLLDDDDRLLPGALEILRRRIPAVPERISVLCFNTVIHTPRGKYPGGRRFNPGEDSYDPSYHALMTGKGLETEGDNRAVLKWTLFPQYLFSEDINGFEGEWWLLIGRDGVGVRYFPETIISIDQEHAGEYLRNVAARRNPGSFIRAHRRIFYAHREFFDNHPEQAAARAVVVLRLAVRTLNPFTVAEFALVYLRARFRSLRA